MYFAHLRSHVDPITFITQIRGFMSVNRRLSGVIVLGVLLFGGRLVAAEQTVFEGDTYRRVFQLLGEPNIEFPRGNTMVRWYEEYELVFKNDTVSSVLYNPNKTPTIDIEVVQVVSTGQDSSTNTNQQQPVLIGASSASNAVELAATQDTLEQNAAETNSLSAVTNTTLSGLPQETSSVSTNQ
ncbi:MAG: hypothetical protein KJN98_07780 [Pontiella sp.]|nr:hypothetical protein [Pontiella sp.]